MNVTTRARGGETLKCLQALEKVDSDATWWNCYAIISGSFPQLVLQTYVLFLNRDFYLLGVSSIALSIASVAWVNVSFYNRDIGREWWSVGETPLSWVLIFLYLHFVGNAGLRIWSVACFAIAFSWYTGVLVGTLAASNLLATSLLVFHPSHGNTSAVVFNVLAEDQRGFYPTQKNIYRWFTLIGYSSWNSICVSPGMSRYGWHWRHRWACCLTNVTVRFMESWIALILCATLPNVSPCKLSSTDRFLSCGQCCRGPLVPSEYLTIAGIISLFYVAGFAVWWPRQRKYYASLEEWKVEGTIQEEEVLVMYGALQRWGSVARKVAGNSGSAAAAFAAAAFSAGAAS